MTNYQENKRSMYLAIQNVCNANKTIWSGLPAFVETFTNFENIITDINIQRQIQEGKTIGVTENKQKEKDEMIQKTIEIASVVYAYAAKIKDNELRQKVNYSPSTLQDKRDTELKDICQLIHDEANTVISYIADYGKSSADLVKLQKEINDYTDILAKPRTAVGTKATATTKLVELFQNSDDLLNNQIDKLIISYQNTSPKFYQQYQSARIIINLGENTKDINKNAQKLEVSQEN